MQVQIPLPRVAVGGLPADLDGTSWPGRTCRHAIRLGRQNRGQASASVVGKWPHDGPLIDEPQRVFGGSDALVVAHVAQRSRLQKLQGGRGIGSGGPFDQRRRHKLGHSVRRQPWHELNGQHGVCPGQHTGLLPGGLQKGLQALFFMGRRDGLRPGCVDG